MINKLHFKSLKDLIDNLKQNKNIIGIIQCGSRDCLNEDQNQQGDYDLTIVLNKFITPNITGLHFYVNDIPVDCMIKTIDQFYLQTNNVFDLMHLNGVIIHDTNNEVSKTLDYFIKHNNKVINNQLLIDKFRYKFTHLKYKLFKRLNTNDLTIKYLFNVSFITFIDFYILTRDIQPGKFNLAFKIMQENDNKLFKLVQEYENTTDEKIMFELIDQIFSYVLQPYNGYWKQDEILFRKDINTKKEDEEMLINYIFNK
ncbi:hypothetical protein mflW37_4650 [Mesoplasma florum W37]|uniref:Nucleotidyltransferase n=1 Tax=Mesoplasma florum TaxID=2151 RepID=A0AAD0HS32_MESFO|nr:hypothetical protein [Mesoplasma florum]AGY41532.1 hypothetical protein mflW37_4650 [Mesoplasma florum W37]AVN65871.1 hypothetical protein MflW12_4660 [Mesoplasma florum]